MPYINVNISKKLNEDDKDALKSKLGALISILPGKTEDVLMVGISDGYSMYFSGQKKDTAFVEVRLYKQSDFDSKSRFTKEVFKFFEEKFGIDGGSLFLCIAEYDSWGFKGNLK